MILRMAGYYVLPITHCHPDYHPLLSTSAFCCVQILHALQKNSGINVARKVSGWCLIVTFCGINGLGNGGGMCQGGFTVLDGAGSIRPLV